MFKIRKNHNNAMYNTLLNLSRKIFFYKDIGLKDTFETRIHLMLFHFSIFMIIFKKKGSKLDQDSYDSFFTNVEYNLRELGFGDVTVNKKMKDLNKILYDILFKINENKEDDKNFKLNSKLTNNYFNLDKENNDKYTKFEKYFKKLFDFCFELPLSNMLKDVNKFNY